MQGTVQVCSSYSDHDPFSHLCFDSMLDLWKHYASGYLAGYLATSARDYRDVKIVRYEDILEQPQNVVNALERLGLERLDLPFEPITKNMSASGGSSREELLAREKIFAAGEEAGAGKSAG